MDKDRSESILRLVFIGIVAPLVVWWVIRAYDRPPPPTPTPVAGFAGGVANAPADPPANAVTITFESANTKEDWINAVTATFNDMEVKTKSGRPIVVEVSHGNSGGAQTRILEGEIQPTLWSPGDQSWIDGANETWQAVHGETLIPDACPQSVYAPIGVGMWRPMAEALGWPDTPISWETLVTLAADPKGWGSYGHPEWGLFKFGHTHPDFSNSGLLTMTSLAYGALGQTEGLTFEMAKSEPVVEAMRNLELITYHYGRQSRALANKMIDRGPSYLHATNITEAELLRLNRERAGEMEFPLVFIFPAEGTFWTEQPLCILDAEWVSAEQAEAAQIYRDYLLAPEQQALTVQYGLRPVSPDIPLQEPFTLANGTDPSITPDIVPALPSPSADVAEAIKDVFHQVKKKATIAVVLDTSGSMQGEKMSAAKAGTVSFINNLATEDMITVFPFQSQVHELQQSGRAGEIGEELMSSVESIFSGGGTRLYDAICHAVKDISEEQSADQVAGQRRLYGVVVLSDGDDTSSVLTENDMYNCLPSGEDVEGVKVFTIAYGNDANQPVLQRIANQTNGLMFEGNPETVHEVYLAISAEQ